MYTVLMTVKYLSGALTFMKKVSKSKKILYILAAVLALIIIASAVMILLFKTPKKISYNNSAFSSSKSESISELSVSETVTEIDTNNFTEDIVSPEHLTINKIRTDIYDGELVLVNNKYEYRYADKAEDIVRVVDYKSSSYSVLNNSVSLKQDIIQQVNNMIDDFYKYSYESANQLIVKSGYRLVSEQGIIYNQNLSGTGLKFSNSVAKPGYSEHHTGYAFDLGFYNGTDYTGSGSYKWINDNCYKYGFIQRYKDNKSSQTGFVSSPCHFRYVGTAHAYAMEVNGLCFEEYIKLIKKFTFEKPFTINAEYGKQYQVYYVKAETSDADTEIYVPVGFEYSISGNNVDGFIITVNGIYNQDGNSNITSSDIINSDSVNQ